MSDKTIIRAIFTGVGFEPPHFLNNASTGMVPHNANDLPEKFCKSRKNTTLSQQYTAAVCLFDILSSTTWKGRHSSQMEPFPSLRKKQHHPNNFPGTVEFSEMGQRLNFYLAPFPHGPQDFKQILSLAQIR